MRPSAERKRASTSDTATSSLTIADTPAALRILVSDWRAAGETVALVPTMGALHAGHLALVTQAQAQASRTVVSIFVNPTQFAPSEDLDRYPRTFAADCALLEGAGADAVYAPSVAGMYPDGFGTTVTVNGAARVGLEDAARPHFFGGVATVVAKLLLQALPDVALFGEKDYQQLCVVAAMTRDLDIPVAIIPVATVREPDGLALSSRNRFLSLEERARAAAIPAALTAARTAIQAGTPVDVALKAAQSRIADAGGAIDYLEAREATTLEPLSGLFDGPIRLLVAARFGDVRLIDNMAV